MHEILDAANVVAKAQNPAGSEHSAAAAGYFIVQWIVLLGGAAIHVLVERRRHPERRSTLRTVELALLWVMVFGGVWALGGGIGHISGNSGDLAESIGYTQSMFQWEVGWADIGIAVLGIGCVRWRNGWMTAAVVMLATSYYGDAIGHIMQWTEHDNTAPDNVWAIPSDIFGPTLAIGLLIWYRRLSEDAPGVEPQPA